MSLLQIISMVPKWVCITLIISMFWLNGCSLFYFPLFPDHIFDKVNPALEALGMECKCLGGGKIEHNSKEKKIRVFGESTVGLFEYPDLEFIHIHCANMFSFSFTGFWQSRTLRVCGEAEDSLQWLWNHLVRWQEMRV